MQCACLQRAPSNEHYIRVREHICSSYREYYLDGYYKEYPSAMSSSQIRVTHLKIEGRFHLLGLDLRLNSSHFTTGGCTTIVTPAMAARRHAPFCYITKHCITVQMDQTVLRFTMFSVDKSWQNILNSKWVTCVTHLTIPNIEAGKKMADI